MHIISKNAIVEFWLQHADAEEPLKAWYDHVKRARWQTPADIQEDYGADVILSDNRAVFNIKGNRYRLVVRVNYAAQSMYIRFIGTHAEYDRIDVTKISLERQMRMKIKPIRTEKDYEEALAQIDAIFDAQPGTPDGDLLELLTLLVEAYEEQRYPIAPPDPIQAIEFHVERLGLTRHDLEPYIGSRARVSEILNRRRPLTLAMIRKLQAGLGIPASTLLQTYPLVESCPVKTHSMTPNNVVAAHK